MLILMSSKGTVGIGLSLTKKRKFFWVFSVLEFAGLIILTILGWIVLDFVI